MSTTLYASGGASITLDDPFSCDTPTEQIGTYRRMADGTLKLDYVATKRTWNVSWRVLALGTSGTAGSGRDQVRTEAIRTGELTWSPPDTATEYTVLCSRYQESQVNVAGDEYYNINITLNEV